MAEYTLSTNLLKSKSKVLVAGLTIAFLAFALYARANGFNFHIKTGQIKGNNISVTEYLDNQNSIEGRVTTTIPDGRGSYYLIMPGNIVVDITPVTHGANLQAPVSHYIRGNIDQGTRIKGIVRRSNPIQTMNLNISSIEHWYEVLPADPFYIEAE